MEFLNTIANTIYDWILDANASNYSVMMNLEVLTWVFVMLLIVTFGTAATYYFVVSKDVAQATRANYRVVFFLGMLVLWLANLIIVPTIVEDWSYALELNNILLSLIDTVYYVILYEIVSIFFKDMSNAKHIHLFNSFS